MSSIWESPKTCLTARNWVISIKHKAIFTLNVLVTLRHSSRYLSQDYIQKVQLRLRFQYKQCCICMIQKVQLRLKFQNKLYCICTSKLAQIHLKFLNFKLLWETPNSKSTQIQILIQTMIHLYHFRKFNWDRNFRTNYTTFVPQKRAQIHLHLKPLWAKKYQSPSRTNLNIFTGVLTANPIYFGDWIFTAMHTIV